ncbi:MAG: FHA domain-containing protein [Synergistaceae bacterium]|jgi:pSer/pThr/pTyr-binding forkhead associated (FHA) protein|nr:FHA domain-containing protein [Synergistaceae bacterium]
MGLIKLCPACGEENPVSEVICRVCMTNLSAVPPSQAGGATSGGDALIQPDGAETRRSSRAALTLSRARDGRTIAVQSGCVLGRSGETLEFFSGIMTVSRRHARVESRGDAWQIEDLGSTNGTWVNGARIDPGRPLPLKPGDTVALSLACEIRVVG